MTMRHVNIRNCVDSHNTNKHVQSIHYEPKATSGTFIYLLIVHTQSTITDTSMPQIS